ncbi:YcdB/YcdC domain-containing protein [Bacillus atrophaeus]|uniref:YcdB/YcdC domain-containing protein n=1 Tax=Bacillus atrophaeus TaxID=1452 RepID=UPI001ABF00B1|nr:YcdB/YcdC domain-containing protein [Bacillus atrophaeus]
MKGSDRLKKEELKERARQIGNVPKHFQLNIEDYGEDAEENRAYFWWGNPDDEDEAVFVELGMDGRLEALGRYVADPEENTLSDELLFERMLQFTETHYPGASSQFVLQEQAEEEDGKVRFSYIQMADGLPIPMTGWYADVSLAGEIVNFRYCGHAEALVKPEHIADEQTALAHYVKNVDFKLMFTVLHSSVYESGDDNPHLVYESYLSPLPADLSECPTECEDGEIESESFPLPLFEGVTEKADINSMIGWHDGLTKVREADMGDGTIGEVWREGPAPEPKDKSMKSWFEGRMEKVMKMIRHKETGKLAGVMSFMDKKGPFHLSRAECEKRALRFLFALFPNADRFFQLNYDEPEDAETIVGFTFEAVCNGVPLRFSYTRICVNRTTGQVTTYMAPDIDPETLQSIDPVPSVSIEKARSIFLDALKVKLAWDKQYGDDASMSYQLVYQPVFPSFIEAHSGKVIRSLI